MVWILNTKLTRKWFFFSVERPATSESLIRPLIEHSIVEDNMLGAGFYERCNKVWAVEYHRHKSLSMGIRRVSLQWFVSSYLGNSWVPWSKASYFWHPYPPVYMCYILYKSYIYTSIAIYLKWCYRILQKANGL